MNVLRIYIFTWLRGVAVIIAVDFIIDKLFLADIIFFVLIASKSISIDLDLNFLTIVVIELGARCKLNLVKVSEFVALAVVDETLAVDIAELIVMAADLDLKSCKFLVPIVVALYYETINAA